MHLLEVWKPNLYGIQYAMACLGTDDCRRKHSGCFQTHIK